MSVAGCNCRTVHEDFDRCYRAVQSKDARFDGWFVTAVLTTGIYCRPSCPVRPPFARNVRFYPTAAAAQRAGFRACKRCRPDASPGSPKWNIRGDLVARAMRLIADGTVDREGVTGLAARLGYTTRQLSGCFRPRRRRPAGPGPRTAHADRARTDRDNGPAFRRCRFCCRLFQHPPVQRHAALGVRQHSDRSCANARPRGSGVPQRTCLTGDGVAAPAGAGPVRLRRVFGHLAAGVVPGCEEVRDGMYRRTLRLPSGTASSA